MAIKEDYEKLYSEIKHEFFDFEIISKSNSSLMKTIDICLKILTLGQMKTFMQSFITTLGNKVYVPETWENNSLISKVEILRHERVHMRQAKKYGRVGFSIMYLLLPLPGGLAYFRKKFEMEAYEESMRALHKYLGDGALNDRLKEHITKQFTSANYFWMWPFRKSVEAWYDETVKKILSGN